MERLRSQMDPAFCWNLTDIFQDEGAWEQALEEAAAQVASIPALAGTLGRSAKDLKAGLDKFYAAARQAELVYIYAMLNSAGDNGDARAQDMEARAMRLFVDFSTAGAFLSPEILSIDPKLLEQWMGEPELAEYRHILEDICRARAHTLSEAEERLLAMLGDAAQTPSNAFSMFESVDMRFPALSGDRPLTHAQFDNAFYVYQYATGFCSAVAIADSILNHGWAGEYLKFLSTGGSMYPIDELKIAGVDLTTPEPIERAMQVFAETLEEFEGLME